MNLVLQREDVVIFVHNDQGELQPLPDDINDLEDNGCLAIVTRVGKDWADIRDLNVNKCGHPCRFRVRSKDFPKISVLRSGSLH